MKTIKKTVLVALMLGTLTSYANGTINSEENITKVTLNDVKKGHQLYIKDSQNQVLYKETLKKSGSFVKRFDFKYLEDGAYFLEIHKSFETVKTPFTIKKGIVFFNNDKEVRIFKPVVRLKENKFLVSKLNPNDTTVSIQIFYDGERIHSDRITGVPIVKRVYQLDANFKGNYTVLVTANNKTYKNNFTL